jgi:hypothetical protein
MRGFRLVRRRDISGVSGTGVVAEGVLFDSGKVVLSWCSEIPSVTVYDSLEHLELVHGHSGATVIRWLPAQPSQRPLRRIRRRLSRRAEPAPGQAAVEPDRPPEQHLLEEAAMPSKASHKKQGGDKDAAEKNTFNPPKGGSGSRRGRREPEEQDPKRRIGQFGGAGEPPLMKK